MGSDEAQAGARRVVLLPEQQQKFRDVDDVVDYFLESESPAIWADVEVVEPEDAPELAGLVGRVVGVTVDGAPLVRLPYPYGRQAFAVESLQLRGVVVQSAVWGKLSAAFRQHGLKVRTAMARVGTDEPPPRAAPDSTRATLARVSALHSADCAPVPPPWAPAEVPPKGCKASRQGMLGFLSSLKADQRFRGRTAPDVLSDTDVLQLIRAVGVSVAKVHAAMQRSHDAGAWAEDFAGVPGEGLRQQEADGRSAVEQAERTSRAALHIVPPPRPKGLLQRPSVVRLEEDTRITENTEDDGRLDVLFEEAKEREEMAAMYADSAVVNSWQAALLRCPADDVIEGISAVSIWTYELVTEAGLPRQRQLVDMATDQMRFAFRTAATAGQKNRWLDWVYEYEPLLWRLSFFLRHLATHAAGTRTVHKFSSAHLAPLFKTEHVWAAPWAESFLVAEPDVLALAGSGPNTPGAWARAGTFFAITSRSSVCVDFAKAVPEAGISWCEAIAPPGTVYEVVCRVSSVLLTQLRSSVDVIVLSEAVPGYELSAEDAVDLRLESFKHLRAVLSDFADSFVEPTVREEGCAAPWGLYDSFDNWLRPDDPKPSEPMLLLGGGGMGKTSSLMALVHRVLFATGEKQKWIPVYIHLASSDTDSNERRATQRGHNYGHSVADRARERGRGVLHTGSIERLLLSYLSVDDKVEVEEVRKRNICVFMDGFDEIKLKPKLLKEVCTDLRSARVSYPQKQAELRATEERLERLNGGRQTLDWVAKEKESLREHLEMFRRLLFLHRRRPLYQKSNDQAERVRGMRELSELKQLTESMKEWIHERSGKGHMAEDTIEVCIAYVEAERAGRMPHGSALRTARERDAVQAALAQAREMRDRLAAGDCTAEWLRLPKQLLMVEHDVNAWMHEEEEERWRSADARVMLRHVAAEKERLLARTDESCVSDEQLEQYAALCRLRHGFGRAAFLQRLSRMGRERKAAALREHKEEVSALDKRLAQWMKRAGGDEHEWLQMVLTAARDVEQWNADAEFVAAAASADTAELLWCLASEAERIRDVPLVTSADLAMYVGTKKARVAQEVHDLRERLETLEARLDMSLMLVNRGMAAEVELLFGNDMAFVRLKQEPLLDKVRKLSQWLREPPATTVLEVAGLLPNPGTVRKWEHLRAAVCCQPVFLEWHRVFPEDIGGPSTHVFRLLPLDTLQRRNHVTALVRRELKGAAEHVVEGRVDGLMRALEPLERREVLSSPVRVQLAVEALDDMRHVQSDLEGGTGLWELYVAVVSRRVQTSLRSLAGCLPRGFDSHRMASYYTKVAVSLWWLGHWTVSSQTLHSAELAAASNHGYLSSVSRSEKRRGRGWRKWVCCGGTAAAGEWDNDGVVITGTKEAPLWTTFQREQLEEEEDAARWSVETAAALRMVGALTALSIGRRHVATALGLEEDVCRESVADEELRGRLAWSDPILGGTLPLRRRADGGGVAQFEHRSLHEFLVARWLVQLPSAEQLSLPGRVGYGVVTHTSILRFLSDRVRRRPLGPFGERLRLPFTEGLLRWFAAQAKGARADDVESRRIGSSALRALCTEGMPLDGVDLSGMLLEDACDLAGADLRNARLEGGRFNEAVLRGADLRGAHLAGASFVRADMEGAKLDGADLKDAVLVKARLMGASLRSARLHSADLWAADLTGADLRHAVLEGANLISAELLGPPQARLTGAYVCSTIIAGWPGTINTPAPSSRVQAIPVAPDGRRMTALVGGRDDEEPPPSQQPRLLKPARKHRSRSTVSFAEPDPPSGPPSNPLASSGRTSRADPFAGFSFGNG